MYRSLIFRASPPEGEEEVKQQETAIYRLGTLLVQMKKLDAIVQLNTELRPVFNYFPKAKTAKIVPFSYFWFKTFSECSLPGYRSE